MRVAGEQSPVFLLHQCFGQTQIDVSLCRIARIENDKDLVLWWFVNLLVIPKACTVIVLLLLQGIWQGNGRDSKLVDCFWGLAIAALSFSLRVCLGGFQATQVAFSSPIFFPTLPKLRCVWFGLNVWRRPALSRASLVLPFLVALAQVWEGIGKGWAAFPWIALHLWRRNLRKGHFLQLSDSQKIPYGLPTHFPMNSDLGVAPRKSWRPCQPDMAGQHLGCELTLGATLRFNLILLLYEVKTEMKHLPYLKPWRPHEIFR